MIRDRAAERRRGRIEALRRRGGVEGDLSLKGWGMYFFWARIRRRRVSQMSKASVVRRRITTTVMTMLMMEMSCLLSSS